MKIRDRIKGLRRVKASDLVPSPKNWRTHPKAQQDALRGILADVGYADAALARELPDGRLMLIDGHLRAETTPNDKIPVLVLDVTEVEADKLLATIDPLAAMATRDEQQLAALRQTLETDNPALQAMWDALADQGKRLAEADEPEAGEPPDEPVAKPGDLWLLGDNRLLCGDSTKRESLAKLMGHEKASLVFTDPPYGIDYDPTEHGGNQFDDIAADSKQGHDLLAFLTEAFKCGLKHAEPTAGWYVWHASITREIFAQALKRAGLAERQYIIWVKPVITLGRQDYQWQHEPCFYAAKDGQRPAFYGDRTLSTAWFVKAAKGPNPTAYSLGSGLLLRGDDGRELCLGQPPKQKKLRTVAVGNGQAIEVLSHAESTDTWQVSRDAVHPEHPTQKPLELAARAIRHSSRTGEIVLDMFLGAGATLLAAEQLGRRCFGLEIEPKYVDVIVARWEKMTGKHAKTDRGK